MLIIFLANSFSSNINIKQTIPYDQSLFTQGVEIIDENIIVGTGNYGESKIGILNTKTGKLMKEQILSNEYFGEGLTYDGTYIWQLTWRENTVFLRDAKTLEIIDSRHFDGEGWGICFDGHNFVVSDGSNYLTVRDAKNFNIIKKIRVRVNGDDAFLINELEFVKGYIYANIWKKNLIYKIDLESGTVVNTFDLTSLFDYNIGNDSGVLNGIAYIKDDLFLLTGKNWNKAFIVQFD